MSRQGWFGRRAFLALSLSCLVAPLREGWSQVETRRATYQARTSLLYGVLKFEVGGTIDESVDQGRRRYQVQIAGQGPEMQNRIESSGVLHDGRWTPHRTSTRFVVYGRESWSEVAYDHARRTIEYHSRSETFLLRRLRLADDVLPMHDGVHVDDVVSATLNYAESRWAHDADATLRTHVVRRRRSAGEGPDDVEKAYRAELVPFTLRVQADPQTGKTTAVFDLTRFSSWARESEPARIVFGPDRRPESITATLILGTAVAIQLGPAAAA